MKLEKHIRDIPDFPKKGILFKDITTLLNNKKAFKKAVNDMATALGEKKNQLYCSCRIPRLYLWLSLSLPVKLRVCSNKKTR